MCDNMSDSIEDVKDEIQGKDLSKHLDNICDDMGGEMDTTSWKGNELDVCIIDSEDVGIVENGIVAPIKS